MKWRWWGNRFHHRRRSSWSASPHNSSKYEYICEWVDSASVTRAFLMEEEGVFLVHGGIFSPLQIYFVVLSSGRISGGVTYLSLTHPFAHAQHDVFRGPRLLCLLRWDRRVPPPLLPKRKRAVLDFANWFLCWTLSLWPALGFVTPVTLFSQ
ncbi:hypothetical protein M427DRAFT_58120 [Gonapodya prolifera JEL478]|uniref:Uncharacterized protein n=1 Tax=Gonapodya prolifera (strain JEL478) TaxID=1344416 RepID=A0A139ABS0_GONPJ|nr:hypothetical protein M427DRAFT_58120 [Gonapodya prolifera JEL478]|eukprot:KXS13863.1 hypothetical protein M427DRAFT_58120 [Gonapodya prolifera JEL478]